LAISKIISIFAKILIMKKKFRVFCNKHQKWEYYTLEDLACGATRSTDGKEFDKSTWSQFIGQYDDTGAEIYEGDLLDYPFRGVRDENAVTFKNWGFWLTDEEGNDFRLLKSKIIGNIYNK